MNKKEKLFFEKIENLKGKEGIIELNDADRKSFAEAQERYIKNESEKKDNYIWLLVGIGMGILGNFVVTLFYDWAKNQERWMFSLLSLGLVLLFILACYILFDQLKDYNRSIDFAHKSKNMWAKAKSLNVGPVMKAYDREEVNDK